MEDKTKNPTQILAGRRLKIFKDAKLFTWQEISNKYKFPIDSLKHWACDGITLKKIEGFAKKLGFESWVFMDEALDDESVKQIFLYPEKQELFAEKLREIKAVSEESNNIKDIEVSEEQDNIDPNKIPRGMPYRLRSPSASRKRSVSGFRSPKKARDVESKLNNIRNNGMCLGVKSPLTSDFEKVSSMVKGIANGFHNLWDTDKK